MSSDGKDLGPDAARRAGPALEREPLVRKHGLDLLEVGGDACAGHVEDVREDVQGHPLVPGEQVVEKVPDSLARVLRRRALPRAHARERLAPSDGGESVRQDARALGRERGPPVDGERAAVKCYGANDVNEGVAIMQAEKVGVSITGNSTNPVRFQHLVAGTYKKWANENGVKYFSVASGGGTGRTLHPDNVAAGPASYGLTDTLGRVHSSAQFAGSSSVPAHVEMMGLIGMGNNPMVGATVACAVAVEEALK